MLQTSTVKESTLELLKRLQAEPLLATTRLVGGKHRDSLPEIRVDISQDPLSAIISFADYLEEFDRPNVSFRPRARQSRMKYFSSCSAVEVNVDASGTMDVCMTYRTEASKAIAAEFKTKETDNYFNPSNGYIDLSGIGIKRVAYREK